MICSLGPTFKVSLLAMMERVRGSGKKDSTCSGKQQNENELNGSIFIQCFSYKDILGSGHNTIEHLSVDRVTYRVTIEMLVIMTSCQTLSISVTSFYYLGDD